jgi:hypothetical protein
MSQINKINVAKLLVFFYLSFNPKNFVALRQTSIMGLSFGGLCISRNLDENESDLEEILEV